MYLELSHLLQQTTASYIQMLQLHMYIAIATLRLQESYNHNYYKGCQLAWQEITNGYADGVLRNTTIPGYL